MERKINEIGNELIRNHASYISGLPLNRREIEKIHTPKANQALAVVAPAGLSQTSALTNVKVISIKLNPAKNPRQLSAIGVVIMLAQLIRLNHATKKITHTRTLISQQSRGFRAQGVKQLLLKSIQKTDTDLPGLGTSIPITKPPATKVIPVKVAVTTTVGVTKTATKVCVVPSVQTQISFPL